MAKESGRNSVRKGSLMIQMIVRLHKGNSCIMKGIMKMIKSMDKELLFGHLVILTKVNINSMNVMVMVK